MITFYVCTPVSKMIRWKVIRIPFLKNVNCRMDSKIPLLKHLKVFYQTATLRAESPSIFLDKSGRGRRLCERLQDSLIRRSSEKMDESAQFPVGETGFY